MREAIVLLISALSAACGDDSVPSAGETSGTTTTAPTSSATTSTPTSADPDSSDSSSTGPAPEDCVAEPPPEAMLRMGLNDDGTFLVAGGRRLTPAGDSLVVPGFPADIEVHPVADVAYISSASRYERKLLVVDLEFGEIVQDIDREGAFFGLAVAPDGSRVYGSGGASGNLEAWTAEVDGTLTAAGELSIGSHPAGLALDATGDTLWVAQWRGNGIDDNKTSNVVEVEATTLTEVRRIEVPLWGWDIVWVPGRDELYVSTLDARGIAVVDLVAGTTVAELDVPISSAGMAVAADGSTVWAAIAGTDEVIAIDTAARRISQSVMVGELLDDNGDVLHDSNVNSLWYDELDDRLYATRGTDNAVSVLQASPLAVLGSIPTGWYPTDVALTPDRTRLLVAEGKGSWIGPSMGASITERMGGSMSTIAIADVDLAASTSQVEDNFTRPGDAYPFSCELPGFPIPSAPGQVSPIEHVVLVVKENKTFDCVFGDFEGVEVDPTLLEWGETFTPNLHALARGFGLSDNFYSEAEVSDTGHLWLTAGHVTEYAERTWIESYAPGAEDFTGYQVQEAAGPGEYFVHLIERDIDFNIYGEIVGALTEAPSGGTVAEHVDGTFPGGPYVNYDVKDEDKALHVAEAIAGGELAPFTYLLLPNDHTVGTTPGAPTPESMVADNDYALGLVVDAISHSPFWESTAIFVVQDDPQGCTDHVDVHRTFVVVVSPWARRGHISHVNSSFASVFATIDRILGVPAIGREDATAAPLWDFFTAIPDATPYDVLPRNVPEEINGGQALGAGASLRMDFGGPDRNPELEPLLLAYRAWRKGEISRAEAEARIAAPWQRLGDARRRELEAESSEEREEFDEALAAFRAWQSTGVLHPVDDD